MNRRSFLKRLGLGGSVSALSACGVDDNIYYTPIEQVLPYVTRPEQVTPGTNSNFATAIGTGPRAWPVVGVHRDGRVINVSGNRLAPVPAAVPAAQLFELQRHYSPDRRQGPQEGGAPVAWDAATSKLTSAIASARSAGKKVVWVGPYRNGAIVELLQKVTDGNAVFWEPLGLDAESLAAKALFGADAGLPRYDLRRAKYVLSFGASFLGDAWGHAGIRAGFAAARDANHGGSVARFAAVTPHRDQTAANADDWYACKPGTEAMVALAIAKLVADSKAYNGPARAMLDRGDPKAAADASGIPEDTLIAISAMFARPEGGAVALPGGVAGASAAATRLAAATYLLNLLAGDRNVFSGGGYAGPVSAYSDIEQLIADLEAGSVDVLMLDDTDPVHVLPKGDRFASAISKAKLVVTTTSHPNETNKAAALVLPTHDVFEDWGDEEPWAGFRILRQPTAGPLHDTRSLGDLLIAAWRAIEPEAAPQVGWRDWLKSKWSAIYQPPVETSTPATAPASPDAFQRWWEGVLIAGFQESRAPRQLEVVGELDLSGSGAPSGSGDYHLHVFAHPFQLDGRYANEPWAQEVPDPMTGQVWGSWALVHPETAQKLGVRDNDLIRLTTEGGTLDIGVEVHPCVRPEVIAVPLGAGRTVASGRYADATGVNVSTLLAATADASGALALQTAKCSVSKVGTAELVSTFGSDEDHNRGFVAVCNADQWKDDEDHGHPGGLTGLHEAPMDPRLVKREEEWLAEQEKAAAAGKRRPVQPEHREFTSFYPVPDHPNYRFAMTVDTNACNGCGACVVACYAENNLPVVGKWKVGQGRQMAWIRVNRYFATHSGDESPSVHFVPLMCQQCGHAPCESVCPVLATYHTIDGLNAMVYNRCVGTRYCANACPYSARRFNYHSYVWPEPFNLQLNPDISARTMGVMEKCTFCVQRIRRTKSAYRDRGFTETIPDEALRQLPACADACPSQAISFGNLIDETSVPTKSRKSGRNYMLLSEINTFPAVNYLARASFHAQHAAHGEASHDGGGHGEDAHGEERG